MTNYDNNNDSLLLLQTPLLGEDVMSLAQHRHVAVANNEEADGVFREQQEQRQAQDAPAASSWWYSNPQQITAMLSNFSTSYNVVNISLVLPILQVLHASKTKQQTEEEEAATASSLLAGMMVGQVGGGALGAEGCLGVLPALRLVMALQVVASLGSAFCGFWQSNNTNDDDIYWELAVWRFVLGVGAGGVYPLAAVLSAAQDNKSSQQDDDDSPLHRVVLTFSTQGLGFVAVPLVTVPLLYLSSNLDVIWRIILGLGSLPGIVLMILNYWTTHHHHHHHGSSTSGSSCCTRRRRNRELVLQTDEDEAVMVQANDGARSVDEQCEEQQQDSDEENESILDSLPDNNATNTPWNDDDDAATALDDEQQQETTTDATVVAPKGWWEAVSHEDDLVRKLLGTACTWFLFDVLFYGNTLFQPIVIEAAFGAREQHTNPIHLLRRTATDSLLLTLIALPGYFVAGWLLGKKSRFCYCGIEQTPRFVMLQGFCVMSFLYFLIGVTWSDLRRFPILLVLLYSLTFFFANYGPNTTTFVLPSLVYSPECRSTFNGLSAAAGKFGALMGATLFAPAADSLGDAAIMVICSGISVVALVMTMFFVPNFRHDEVLHTTTLTSANTVARSTEDNRNTII